MAHHLKILESAGMVVRRRSEGDRRRTYLTLSDTSVNEGDSSTKISAGRVVFVCSANSARSQLAAALWVNASDVPVTSAGTHPATHIAEGARAVAARRSLSLVSAAPQRFDDLAAGDDFVVAVCDNAYEELGPATDLHWSIPDPVSKGNDEAFDSAYTELERRITALSSRLIAS
jgi:protein-tyrosine-phosphatase